MEIGILQHEPDAPLKHLQILEAFWIDKLDTINSGLNQKGKIHINPHSINIAKQTPPNVITLTRCTDGIKDPAKCRPFPSKRRCKKCSDILLQEFTEEVHEGDTWQRAPRDL